MNSSSTPSEPIIVLQTKLYPPQARPHFIQRPQLVDYLNQGLDRKLTLITAPAGYGKTTIVSQWLDNLRSPKGCLAELTPTQETQIDNAALRPLRAQIAWLSLDEYDNDLHLFVRYVVAAIQTVWADSCSNTLAVLQNPQQAPVTYLAHILVNDLIALPEALILVLDDYHFVKEQHIHDFLNRLLDHWPQSVHLVLISRTEPPLSLPQLRVRQQLSELRVADLSFSHSEAEQYLTQATGRILAPETVLALQDRNEGWVAGLYLATLSMGNDASEQALVRHVQSDNENILDYLFTEVLAKQPAALQDFLLRTAILNRFCNPLCEALLGDEWLEEVGQDEQLAHVIGISQRSVQSIIEWLSRHHLFSIALDDSGEWYRYHHLFQLMLTHNLQKRMGPSEIATLHRNASRWLAKERLIDEALQHALAAEDTTFTIQLIEQYRVELLDQFDFYTLERWLALLPEAAVEHRPALLLLRGWISWSTYRMEPVTAIQLAQRAEDCLENPEFAIDPVARSAQEFESAALRAIGWYWKRDFQKVLHYALPVIDGLPASPAYIRSIVVVVAAFSLLTTQQPVEAIGLITKELDNENIRVSLPGIQLAAWLPYLHCMTGHLQEAIQVAYNVMSLMQARSINNVYTKATLFRWLGYVYYQWNDLDRAMEYLAKVDQAHTAPFHNSQLNLAWIYEIQGQPKAAQQIIMRLRRHALDIENKMRLHEIDSFQARCWHWQGEVDLAAQKLDEATLGNKTERFLAIEEPVFTQVRILVDQKQEESWQTAERLLRDEWSHAQQMHNIPHQIEIIALEALLYQRQGKTERALSSLERAIQLAKVGGFIRTFVDLGPSMAGILNQLLARGIETDYLGQILAAFPQAIQTDELAQRGRQATQTQLIEPLTARESEILLQLQEGLPNKLIARDLDISDSTVKRHTINLYQKLGVNSRKQAVARAKALGILPIEESS
ncbi:MAG: LuxR C-terminal-related transcriptional regulator [Chloroflexota bacterium]